MVMTAADNPNTNPAVVAASQAERLMVSILAELGMTPASRSRVKVDTTSLDPLGQFLAERKS
jgi:phage terminase small subunit